MAASIRRLHIGVIAEEHNDVDVLHELIRKLVDADAFHISRFVGHGCGLLKRKCGSWAQNLRERGCRALILLHDLDRQDESVLRVDLAARLASCGFRDPIILIPVEELEAWLLCDAAAIRTTFNMHKVPRLPASPENIQNPKEWLGKLVARYSHVEYLNTIHNKKIAERIDVTLLTRCPSYLRLPRELSPFVPRVARLCNLCE